MAVPPCFRNETCIHPSAATSDLSQAKVNQGGITDSQGLFAHMGWVGYVNLKVPPLTPTGGSILRTTSADINLSQDITTPDVIDGRIDRTVYQLGPKIVGGTLSLPVIADVDPGSSDNAADNGCISVEALKAADGSASTLVDTIWCWTTARTSHGRLAWQGSLDIRYANHAAFTFTKAVVNSLSMSVAQSDIVTFDVDIIGAARNPTIDVFNEPVISDFLSPARVLTWNDVTVSGVGGCGVGGADSALFGSAQIREFSFEINNNAERYYSLNGRLVPIDINVSKREITGSLTLLGLQDRMRERAEKQQDEFTRKDEIRLMFFIGDEAVSGVELNATDISRDWFADSDSPELPNFSGFPFFWKKFTGVIFQIEEMSLTNDVFETTVNWLALGNDQEQYMAIAPGSSCDFPAWSA